MKKKRIPLRMCIGCHEMKPKKELVRIVRDKEGTISVDLTGKKSGRGAYICRSSDCLSKARKGRKLDKALETAVDEAVYTVLEEQMGENNA
ncbi:MAG: YlxR family protein [Acetivibrionales bacterium]|nr:YlxR family protein [Bacillota bacterium]NLP07943.1 YlxR family protein [Clostridiaceae bacterium]HOA54638.1 YlxR family protein [Clostridiales bacterium]HPZ05379.1 YlxR family protein [Clostridiales bacterium]HQD30335.1 YlxR family protein [Clostridiales bacterium]